MSKIKNTGELVLRAQAHARHDRIRQGTYGDASVNGHAEYKGCFIGCLSTPHRKRDLFSFLRKARDEGSLEYFDDHDQRLALHREFGICLELSYLCEAIFEGLPTHGAAIEFLPAFAKALAPCEGKRITDAQVQKLRRRSENDTGDDYLPLDEDNQALAVRNELFAYLEKRAG